LYFIGEKKHNAERKEIEKEKKKGEKSGDGMGLGQTRI